MCSLHVKMSAPWRRKGYLHPCISIAIRSMQRQDSTYKVLHMSTYKKIPQ